MEILYIWYLEQRVHTIFQQEIIALYLSTLTWELINSDISLS